MNPTPHRNSAAIHAYADGKPIQFRSKMVPTWTDFTSNGSPAFASLELEWRPKHKWQRVIDAAAAGKAIQHKCGGAWYDEMLRSPVANPDLEWRIRPRLQWTRLYLSRKGEPELAWTEDKADLDDDPCDLTSFDRWLDDEWREHELEG
jgi:hypothetical protein